MRDDELLADPGKPENRGGGCIFYAAMALMGGAMVLIALGMTVTRGG